MKVEINKAVLQKTLKSLSPLTGEKGLYPVLENVTMSLKDDKLSLAVTDLKTSVICTLGGTDIYNIEDGSLMLPLKNLLKFLSILPKNQEMVRLSSEVFNGIITYDKGKLTVTGDDPEMFPNIPILEPDSYFLVKGEGFKELIKKSVFACSKEVPRYNLENVQIRVAEDYKSLRFVGTDGKSLAFVEAPIIQDADSCLASEIKNKDLKSFLISSKSLIKVEKLLKLVEWDSIKVGVNNSNEYKKPYLILNIGNYDILCTLAQEDIFPPVDKVIPKDVPNRVILKTKDFINTLKKVNSIIDKKNDCVGLDIIDNQLIVRVDSKDIGKAQINIDVEQLGADLCSKFSLGLLLKGLKVISEKEIGIIYNTGQNPIVIVEKDFKYIILPIKIEDKQ